MSDSTLNASQFQSTARGEGRQVDPILEAMRKLQGDESVHQVVDPESPTQEESWDPWS